MAGRIRTIKPEWIEDETMLLASPAARVLSIALILLADDYGNGRANEKLLVSRIFPGHSREGSEAFRELREGGFFGLYEVRGQTYFTIRNWTKHQRVDKPGKPRVPLPCDQDAKLLDTLAKVPGSLATDHDHDHDHDRESGAAARSQENSGDSRESSRDAYRSLAHDLWQEQQQLRTDLGRNSLGLMPPADVGREIIDRITEQAGPDGDLDQARRQCRHVLAVARAECKADPSKTQFLDGRLWTPQRFLSALSRVPGDSATPRVKNGATGVSVPSRENREIA